MMYNGEDIYICSFMVSQVKVASFEFGKYRGSNSVKNFQLLHNICMQKFSACLAACLSSSISTYEKFNPINEDEFNQVSLLSRACLPGVISGYGIHPRSGHAFHLYDFTQFISYVSIHHVRCISLSNNASHSPRK